MVNIKLRKQNGYMGEDIMISIIVIIIFISIITTIAYQIYANSQAIERNAQATSYAIEILEKVDILQYDSVTEENLYPTSNIPARIYY